jgi:3D (Asp-Asp-Asp) domain-containing protein
LACRYNDWDRKDIGLIGRSSLRRSHLLAVSVLTAGLVWAGFLTSPSPAYAGDPGSLPLVAHTVIFTDGTATETVSSNASTVADFLRQRGIVAGENDALAPAVDTPLSDKMTIVYRQAVPVTIVMENRRETLLTSAPDVATLLVSENIHLGPQDTVEPALDAAPHANGIIRITRVIAWNRVVRRSIPMLTVQRLDFKLSPGQHRVVAKGRPGIREEYVAFVQRDGGPVSARVTRSRVVRKPRTHVVDIGVTEMQAYEHFANASVRQAGLEMRSTLEMIATAYTSGCAGCSGITAIGRPAGHGIVAVDPRVIPLGTKLYIPGYGFAIAGDTGGAIQGNRIDLGFDSLRDALIFGRREVTVYRLK